MKVVERDDTAGSAREIAEQRLRGTAAICGAGAAELYGLEILERGYKDNLMGEKCPRIWGKNYQVGRK